MSGKLKETLYRATVLTFEELCFMFPAPELEDELKGVELEAAASVEFQGSFDGELVVRTCGELYRAIASNMLGEDNCSAQQQRDALGEIANVICGNMLPGIAGAKEVFNIDAPHEVDSEKPAENPLEKPAAEVSMALDQGRTVVSLFINNGQPLS